MATQILPYPAAKLIPLLSSLLRDNVRTDKAPPQACPMVVGYRFYAPHPLELFVENKLTDEFVIKDINRKVMLSVERKFFSLFDTRVLLDAVGKPLLTLQKKPSLFRKRWEAFLGESTDARDLLFSVRTSIPILFRTNLEVFFASNSNEHIYDFKLEGESWLNRSYLVTLGDTSKSIARIQKDPKLPSLLLGKNDFRVNMDPNVDYAFLVALVVILNEIEKKEPPKYIY